MRLQLPLYGGQKESIKMAYYEIRDRYRLIPFLHFSVEKLLHLVHVRFLKLSLFLADTKLQNQLEGIVRPKGVENRVKHLSFLQYLA